MRPEGPGHCSICLEPIPDGAAGVFLMMGAQGPELKPTATAPICLTCVERIGLVGKIAAQIARIGSAQKGTPSC